MLNWLYRRISAGIMKNIDVNTMISRILEDEKLQIEILEFTDALFERYKIKAISSLNSLQDGSVGSGSVNIPNLITSRGKINLKGLIPLALDYFSKRKGGSAPQQGLP